MSVNRSAPQKYLFLAGTTKGGTSSLYLWLNQHPCIGLSARKELHFFCACPAPHLRAATDFSTYNSYFSSEKEVTGEASPCYFYYPQTPSLINELFPQAAVLVSLRDPVERFWSHYLMNEIYRPTGLKPESVLEKCLADGRTDALNDLFGVGLYTDQLQRYLAVFGWRRLRVSFLEEMDANPSTTLASVFELLDLEMAHIDTRVRDKQYVEPRGPLGRLALRNSIVRKVGVRLAPSQVRRFLRTEVLGVPDKPPLAVQLRDRLRELYRDDSIMLERLLGRDLPWSWHRE